MEQASGSTPIRTTASMNPAPKAMHPSMKSRLPVEVAHHDEGAEHVAAPAANRAKSQGSRELLGARQQRLGHVERRIVHH